ncbi:MAG: hypothetical protein V7609_603 [Verrucomicrobiota bacterium]
MDKMRILRVAIGVALLVAQSAPTADAGATVTLQTVWEHDAKGYFIMMRPVPPKGAAPYSRAIIDAASPLFAEPECLKLFKQDRTKRTEVKFTIEARPREGKKLFIKIRPVKPETLSNYAIDIHTTAAGEPALILDDGGSRLAYADQAAVKPLNPANSTTTVGETKLDTSKLKLGEGFISILSGAGGAILSGKIDARLGRVIKDQIYINATASADISIEGTDPKKYFNSIIGQVNATYVLPNKDYFIIGHGSPEFGLVGRIESDKEFKTINGTLGLGVWFTVDNGITRAIGNAIYIGRRVEIDPPNHAPAVWLSYDYVGKLKNDDAGSTYQTGNNRFKANLYWPLWIAHGWDLTAGIVDSKYSLRLLIDVTPIYDIQKSRGFVEEKVSLEVMPETTTGKKPAFVLSYANGKATPTFTNVNTFLAGFKMPW